MTKNLDRLLSSLRSFQIFGSRNIKVSGIESDSRKVRAGYLFVAIKGATFDGHDFIPQAAKLGACAIVGEKAFKKIGVKNITYVKVPNSRKALALLASAWYNFPTRKMRIIGVTGTDGKTTTANLIYAILKSAGKKVGLVSTINAKIGDTEIDTGLHVTNPEPLALQALLAKMVKAKCEYAVLEVTSHGLDQERVAGVNFEVGVLTNIAHEHLDYHKTFDNYVAAKAKLFVNSKIAILNRQDTSFNKIRDIIPRKVQVISYDLNVLKNVEEAVNERFPERYNRLNAAAAVSVAKILEIDEKDIAQATATFPQLAGRLEEVRNERGIKIFVDFAHTPNALENVLGTLKEKTAGRLIVVFGCAGERDKEKRPMMGEISGKLADISIFTAEDPRSEDVNVIIQEMANGAIKAGAKETRIEPERFSDLNHCIKESCFFRIPERGEAIAFAIQKIAKKGDTLVICGKGHEKSMAYDSIEHHWSDFKTALNSLSARDDLVAIVLAAGKGTRMEGRAPKVLRAIAGRPMLSYTLESLRKSRFGEIIIVVGYKADDVKKHFQGASQFAFQPKALGTANALECGLKIVPKEASDVVVLNGDDSAFWRSKTILDVVERHTRVGTVVTFVSVEKGNPEGLGRVIRDSRGKLLGIIEEKEATFRQKRIKEVNDGFYVFDCAWLRKSFSQIKRSPSGEYYLVDLIKVALDQKRKVEVYQLKDSDEWFGINTEGQLNLADKKKTEIVEEKLRTNENN